jgi:hypothetical protein
VRQFFLFVFNFISSILFIFFSKEKQLSDVAHARICSSSGIIPYPPELSVTAGADADAATLPLSGSSVISGPESVASAAAAKVLGSLRFAPQVRKRAAQVAS